MNVFTNALLLEVRAPGAIDRTGAVGVGTVLWTGRAGGYLKRQRAQTKRSGEEDKGRMDTFTILRSQAPVLEQAGPNWKATTILVEDHRGQTPVQRHFTVQGMEDRAVGSIVDSVRLELSNEAP
jgi:hypothetical protein